jgi:hypothetical protein
MMSRASRLEIAGMKRFEPRMKEQELELSK